MKKLVYFLFLLLFLVFTNSCDHKPWTKKVTISDAKVVNFKEGEVCNVAIGIVTGNMGIGFATAEQPVLYLKITGQNDTIPLKVSRDIISDLKETRMIKVKKTIWFDGDEEKEINYEFVSIK